MLIEKAQAAGDGHAYQVVNVAEQEFFPAARFDLIFSFSFVQYLNAAQLATLNRSLFSKPHPGGKICHLSIPDRRKQFLYCVCNQLSQGQSQVKAWAIGTAVTLAKLHNPKMSGGISRMHCAPRLLVTLPPGMQARVKRPSDSWYRFDLIAKSRKYDHEQ